VVLAHGLTGSKEWYIQMSRQLAKEGFVVLSIDLRGHGGSSGYCTFAYDEANDVIAAGDYLKKNVAEVDPAHITAMGHSLGGITVTRAGVVQPSREFSSVVAIWCWTGLKDALTDLAGPLDAFIGRSWLFTTFSKNLDVNSPETQARYAVINSVDDSKPPNYMLAIGSADELASVEREQELMEKVTQQARRTGPEPKLKENVTYGDFASGTARRLVVTNDDHVAELASGVIVGQAIDWIKQDAGLPVTARQGPPFLWGRFLGIIVLALGIFAAVMGLLSLTRKRLFPDGGEIVVAPPWDYPSGRQTMDILVYALPVIAARSGDAGRQGPRGHAVRPLRGGERVQYLLPGEDALAPAVFHGADDIRGATCRGRRPPAGPGEERGGPVGEERRLRAHPDRHHSLRAAGSRRAADTSQGFREAAALLLPRRDAGRRGVLDGGLPVL
jgi:acetyl esterase/lipase